VLRGGEEGFEIGFSPVSAERAVGSAKEESGGLEMTLFRWLRSPGLGAMFSLLLLSISSIVGTVFPLTLRPAAVTGKKLPPTPLLGLPRPGLVGPCPRPGEGPLYIFVTTFAAAGLGKSEAVRLCAPAVRVEPERPRGIRGAVEGLEWIVDVSSGVGCRDGDCDGANAWLIGLLGRVARPRRTEPARWRRDWFEVSSPLVGSGFSSFGGGGGGGRSLSPLLASGTGRVLRAPGPAMRSGVLSRICSKASC
jgi:hypothetical protein